MAVNYTEDELYLLATVPQIIGSAMTFAGGSGIFGTGKELFASAQSVLAGVKDYPGNALIQAVVPNLSGDRQAAMEQARKCRDWATARLKAKGVNSSEKLRLQALADCREAAGLLASKSSSQEAAEYKQWAFSVAEKVAAASTEGGFLGFGGERLSAGETQLLGELRTALGVRPAAA
jgi:hypothetical protein